MQAVLTLLIICLAMLASDKTSIPRVPAFPAAEGFGKYATGGRGGKVLIVTSLSDSGPGSLREAVLTKGPRIIVFEVSGTVSLESPLRVREGDVTIAGQSAPGDGICLRDYPFIIDADNVIIRYMRFRLGDSTRQESDAITSIRHKNIIIDHCSMSWATDECASFYDNSNFTLQWSMVTESLNHSVHTKGDHGYGGIWGGMGATFHHNLVAHHNSRLPRFCGSRYHGQEEKELVDFRNNVIYNWMNNSSYAGERGQHNIVANYYQAGPATKETVRQRIVEPYKPYGRFFVEKNYVENFPHVTRNNWLGVACGDIDSVRVGHAFPVELIVEQEAKAAYELVLQYAGASLRRDPVDSRIVEEVRTGTAPYGKNGIIDSQDDVGGWPELKPAEPPVDSDRDGMPDDWEDEMKLRRDSPDDAVACSLDKRYTNIEVYLNSLVPQPWK